MERLDVEGRLAFPRTPEGRIARKHYLSEQDGPMLGDVWTDIPLLQASSAERLGYPTQKPEVLLERIVQASSNAGDIVLDPFCGCGTAIAVAERLGRKLIGIDITHLAIAAIVKPMGSAFQGIEIRRHGEPVDLGSAQALANLDRYDFQDWTLTLVTARRIAQDAQGKSKRGADRGIDVVISFLGKDVRTPARRLVQVKVKSGHVNSATIRDLVGTAERGKADIGLLITLEEPTGPMRIEALEAGYYRSEFMQRDYPRIQMITIKELLHSRETQLPPHYSPYQLANRQQHTVDQRGLFEQEA